jgi:biopolymer transport protein ExbD
MAPSEESTPPFRLHDPQARMTDEEASSSDHRSRAAAIRARYRERRSSSLMSLNLTPMIDIVFLLIFFFLTVSQFRRAEGMLPAQLPSRAGSVSTEIPRTPLRVELLADPDSSDACLVRIEHFTDAPIPIQQLRAALMELKAPERGFDSRTPIHLLAPDRIAWDHVVNAYNAALAARYERIFFADTP